MNAGFLSYCHMATSTAPLVPMGEGPELPDAAVQRTWRKAMRLSSLADRVEHFVASAGFDRAPWLTVAFATGIGAWFILRSPWQWASLIGLCLIAAIAAAAVWRHDPGRAGLRLAIISLSLALAAGVGVVWTKSGLVGAEPIGRATVTMLEGRILERQEQNADGRIRLVMAIRDADRGTARKVRVNVPLDDASGEMVEGAIVRLRARLSPPAPPLVPGGYDFARRAWFDGLAATGSSIGPVTVVQRADGGRGLAAVQRSLSRHVRSRVSGSEGAIAAAFASGDRGAISEADDEAMRDSGLTHLLSISGVHVSAVIAAAYLLIAKLMALWPWFALRFRIPLVAAAGAAIAGIGYTLLTGAEVPTVRSCIGALLVLAALAIGREPLSVRMLAVAAFAVLLLWPEALIGPSFQMSFAAVLAIVALHESRPVKAFLAPREERWLSRQGRRLVMLVVTGLVIEAALTPVVLFHFHRAGLYGAFANVVAIPLVTLVSMPAIAIGLVLDLAGLGAPAWWVAERSLAALLGIAHWTAGQPGAVKLMPQIGRGTFALFVAGGLWLALWRGRIRLAGLAPVLAGAFALCFTPTPDILVTSDGRQVGIAGEGERLLVLRDSRSSYVKDNLLETSGLSGEPVPLAAWPGARCSRDFCVVSLQRDGREWTVLLARSRERIEERALASACEQVDIVVADRWLPASCRPRWLKADRRFLAANGGLAIYLKEERIETVAATQGEHGWWREPEPRQPRPAPNRQ